MVALNSQRRRVATWSAFLGLPASHSTPISNPADSVICYNPLWQGQRVPNGDQVDQDGRMAVPDAVLGAGSALAGVLLTVIAGALRERRRLRWEDDRRWADRKRERYLDLLKASRTVTDALLDIAKAQVRLLEEWFSGQERLPGFPPFDSDFESGQEALHRQAVLAAFDGWDELEIVAPPAVFACAEEHFRLLDAWRERLYEVGDFFLWEFGKAKGIDVNARMGFQLSLFAEPHNDVAAYWRLPQPEQVQEAEHKATVADYQERLDRGLEDVNRSRQILVDLLRRDLQPPLKAG
jgi:hypothetical protein